MSLTTAIILAGAFFASVAALRFAARSGYAIYSRHKNRIVTRKDMLKPAALALGAILVSGFLWYGFANAQDTAATVTNRAGSPPVAQTAAPAAPEDEDEEVFLDAIHLTERQVEDFVSKHTLNFVDRSLVNNDAKSARLKAVRDFCGDAKAFVDAVNWPVESWFPDYAKLADTSLSASERDQLIEDFFDALDQEMISNVPFGLMMLHGAKEIPYIYKNNTDLIDSRWEIVQQMFAGTYKQPKDDATAMQIELNHIADLPDGYHGVDYFVAKQPGVSQDLVVRKEWAQTVAYLSAAYRGYFVQGIEARESIKNWCLPSTIMEDSKALPVLADYQESREAIILDAVNKSGKSSSIIGLNTADSRLEVFPTTTPKVEPETPKTPDPEPPEPELPPSEKPKPTPDPEPQLPKEQDYRLQVFFQLGDGTELFPTVTERHKANEPYDIKVTEDKNHYEVDMKSCAQLVDRDGLKYVSGTMPAKDLDLYVIYDPYLVIYYREYPSGLPCSIYVPTCQDYKEVHKYQSWYSVLTPPYLRGWTPSEVVVEGKMPATYKEVTVWYSATEDGKGVKNPADSSQNQGNAPIGGGSHRPTDGTGDDRPNDPDNGQDYPETPEQNPVINTPSKDPINAGDDEHHESSGGGGQDHPIQDPNDGFTDNGDVPETPPIDKDPNTSGTDLGTGASGQKPEDEGANNGEILPPP